MEEGRCLCTWMVQKKVKGDHSLYVDGSKEAKGYLRRKIFSIYQVCSIYGFSFSFSLLTCLYHPHHQADIDKKYKKKSNSIFNHTCLGSIWPQNKNASSGLYLNKIKVKA